jgi:hypothetical protein
MRGVAGLARIVEKRRAPPPKDNPWIARERAAIEQVAKAIEWARELRDTAEEQTFALLYGVAPSDPLASVNAGKVHDDAS